MQQIFPLKNTVAQLKAAMFKKQIDLFKLLCENKPKLRTFMMFKDFENQPEVKKVVNPVILDDRKYIQIQGLAQNI